MDVSQELVQVGTTAHGTYILDCFLLARIGTSAVLAKQNSTSNLGFNNEINVTVTTAQTTLAAGDAVFIFTDIEGYRSARLGWGLSAAASPIVLGFWTAHHRTGLYSGFVRHGASSRIYPFSYTQDVADAWEYKTVSVSGDTGGTWIINEGIGLSIGFAMALGSSGMGTAGAWTTTSGIAGVTGQVNAVGSTSDVFRLTGLVVLPGVEAPSALRSPFIMRPFPDELLASRRYLHVLRDFSAGNPIAAGLAYTTTTGLLAYRISPTMRATPTLGFSAASDFGVRYPSGVATASAITWNGNSYLGQFNVTVPAVLTAGHGAILEALNSNAKLFLAARI
jgi:hypothetical protein